MGNSLKNSLLVLKEGDRKKIVTPASLLRLRLHGDVFTRKCKLLFADAPFVYMKTVKTLALSFHVEDAAESGTF